MDIFIKSFNRPYYLHRCIQSIHTHVIGDFTISILDDGTPQHYLDKLHELFPQIKIYKSDQYIRKVKAIDDHLTGKRNYEETSIPVNLWRHHIAQGTEVFLLLEEDCWITDSINTSEFAQAIKQFDLCMLRLSWNSNPNSITGNKRKLTDTLEEIIPILPIDNPMLIRPLFQNWLKVRSVLFKTGVLKINDLLPYYSLYSVSSVVFRKDYWLYLWANADAKVNELNQVFNALMWKRKHKQVRYAKTNTEITNTSFITTSSPTVSNRNFDMHKLNHLLNTEWFAGNLDVMQNYPHDFAIPYLHQLLLKQGVTMGFLEGWEHWIVDFKTMYRKMGCQI